MASETCTSLERPMRTSWSVRKLALGHVHCPWLARLRGRSRGEVERVEESRRTEEAATERSAQMRRPTRRDGARGQQQAQQCRTSQVMVQDQVAALRPPVAPADAIS